MEIFSFLAEQWILVGILIALIAALVSVEGKRGGATLSYHEVTRLVNAGEAVLLDIRDSKDFSAGHIVDAINIPLLKLPTRMSELQASKEKTIIVIDKMGQHAGSAGKSLLAEGYKAARLQGGMTEWHSQNLPVVKS